MAKENTFEEAAAIGAIRSELNSIQVMLAKGPKRTADRRKTAWEAIAKEAAARAASINPVEKPADEQKDLIP